MNPTPLEPRISLVSLGVSDVARARRFYVEGLGWSPVFETPEVVFFQMGGLAFGLWAYGAMARETGQAAGPVPVGGMSLAYNVRTKAEVNSALASAVRGGARRVKAAEDTPWGGRSGYFSDPDGHLWEVAWNPAWPLDAEGRVTVRA